MEQGVVMIPMYHSNGTHCGLARIRYMGNFALVDVRWSGRPRNNLELVVLTQDGPRSVRDGRVPINPNRSIYGIAALDSDGNCVCCGSVRGEERAFAQAMLLLRLGFPIGLPRPEPPRPRPPRPEPPPGPRPPRPEPPRPRPPRPEPPPGPRPPRPEPPPGPRPPRPRPPFGSPGRRMMADAEYFDASEVSEALPSPAIDLDAAMERASGAMNNTAAIQPFGPDVMPITSEQAEALLREGSQEELSIPGMTEPIAPVRPQGYIYDSLTAEPAQLTMSTPAGVAETSIPPAPQAEARATFLERTAPPAQRTRPLMEQPMRTPAAPASPTAPGTSGKFAPYTPPAPAPMPARTPAAPAAPTAPRTSGKYAPYTPPAPAPARTPAAPAAPTAPGTSGKFAPYTPPAPAPAPAPVPARTPAAPAAPTTPKPSGKFAPYVPAAPIQPTPPRPAPTAPTAPPRPAPTAPPPAPPRPAPTAPPPAPPKPAPTAPPAPPKPAPTAPPAPLKTPCPGLGENIVQPARREMDRCGENTPEHQNICEPQQNLCGRSAAGRRPRCDTAQDICRSYTPTARCGECFAEVPWEADVDAGIPVNARPYVAPQMQQLQPGNGAVPQAPMQPAVWPPIQATQPGAVMPQPGMGTMPMQPGTGTIPQAPMQPGTVMIPQAPMQPAVRPPIQATQPGAVMPQPGMGTMPMQPGTVTIPQAPMQPAVRPPMQAAPNTVMPQPGMGTMPMQPGTGTMPQVPSMQPTVRPPAQAAQPGTAPQPSVRAQPGTGTIPPFPPMQPGTGTVPQAPSMQPAVRPPAQAALPNAAMPQPGVGTMPQIPSAPPVMIPPFPGTQPGFGTPMPPNNGSGVMPPSTQPIPRPPQQGTGIQSGQGTMRPPTIQVPEIMQPMLPPDDEQTPTARQPGAGTQQQPMSPANSAALQQILQQASEIFPGQELSGNAVPASAAAPQPATRVAQTSEEWQREVDALLQGQAPEAPSAEVTAPAPGGRRQSTANPFPGQFPDSEWARIDPPNGEGYFYEGHMRRGNDRFFITAVPGEYRPVPPRHLQGQGFGRYIPSRSGGCWVRIQKER